MTQSRAELHVLRARWLRVRANVRVLAAKLIAAAHALQRDARRSDDPHMDVLVDQLAAERRAIDALAHDLDARLQAVEAALRTIEAAGVADTATRARAGRPGSAQHRVRGNAG